MHMENRAGSESLHSWSSQNILKKTLQHWREKNPKRHPWLIKQNLTPHVHKLVFFYRITGTAKPLLQWSWERGGGLPKSSNENSKQHTEKASSLHVFASKQCFKHICQFVLEKKMHHAVHHLLPALAFPLLAAFQWTSKVNIQRLCIYQWRDVCVWPALVFGDSLVIVWAFMSVQV